MFSHAPVAIGSTWKATVVFACFYQLATLLVPPMCYGQSTRQKQETAGSGTGDKEQVLRHVVFFGFKSTSTKKDIDDVVAAFRALPSKIKAIRRFQWGEKINRSGLADGLTHCFLLTFEDEDGRAAYLPHPDHKAFGAALGPHLDKVFVIDYWGRPQTKRAEKELKHAVFFKFKDGTSEDDVRAVEEALAELPSEIDAVKAFEWGKNNSPESHDEGFTHCFMFTFDSEEDLKEYVVHPAHRVAADALRLKMEKIRVIDFWAVDVSSSGLSDERHSR